MSSNQIDGIEKILGYSFRNRDLVAMALTHSSAGRKVNYERLEFLGDRVLGLSVAEMLYKRFPDEPEGHLAKRLAALVQGPFLADIAKSINLGGYIRFSESEQIAGGADNDNILADVFEALIGALYLDGGFRPCHQIIETLWTGHLHEMKAPPQHPKTALQEWAQGKALPLPVYEIVNQTGPDHAPVFEVRLVIEGYDPVHAQGASRQVAEKQAAQAFLENIADAERVS